MRNFEHSTNVLIKAYIKNTLKHGFCQACAVGNLVANAMNINVSVDCDDIIWRTASNKSVSPAWNQVFVTGHEGQERNPPLYRDEARTQIDATGYSWQELADIEKAFESVDGDSNDDRMFNGLVAVFNVLADIHQVDLTTRHEALESLSQTFSSNPNL